MTQSAYPVYLRTPPRRTRDDAPAADQVAALRGWTSDELAWVAQAIPVRTVKTLTAAYTATPSDEILLCNATGAAFTVTLPAAARVQFMRITIKKIDASANAITIGATVDGAASPTIATQWHARQVVSDGILWYFVSTYP